MLNANQPLSQKKMQLSRHFSESSSSNSQTIRTRFQPVLCILRFEIENFRLFTQKASVIEFAFRTFRAFRFTLRVFSFSIFYSFCESKIFEKLKKEIKLNKASDFSLSMFEFH